MQKLFRYYLCGLLSASTLATSALASPAIPCRTDQTDYVVVNGSILNVVPDQYMQASAVQVTVKTNTGYTASRQTTAGVMVTFNLPDGATRTTVETKYTVGATEYIVIDLISGN